MHGEAAAGRVVYGAAYWQCTVFVLVLGSKIYNANDKYILHNQYYKTQKFVWFYLTILKGVLTMAIKYYKLIDYMNRHNINNKKLCEDIGTTRATFLRMRKGGKITTDIIDKICARYGLQPADIMEYEPDAPAANDGQMTGK